MDLLTPALMAYPAWSIQYAQTFCQTKHRRSERTASLRTGTDETPFVWRPSVKRLPDERLTKPAFVWSVPTSDDRIPTGPLRSRWHVPPRRHERPRFRGRAQASAPLPEPRPAA